MSVQSDSSMLLANTTNASGTITLPSATIKPGRVITCKDIGGNAGVSSIILSTISGQMFEDGLSIRTINQAYGFESFIATSGGKWLTVAGNELYDIGASTATLQKTVVSSITANQYLYQGNHQPYIQYGISTFQTNEYTITLPVNYVDANYAVQITPYAGSNRTIIPYASTISSNSFIVHGTSGDNYSWTTFGKL